jgi:hypothetical protein
MSTLTFDTLKFANQLKTAGVPASHAEAEAKALSEVFEANWSELSTKADLREVETNLRHEIGDLRKDMDVRFAGVDARLEKMKFELLKWLIGLTVAQVGLVISLLKLLP